MSPSTLTLAVDRLAAIKAEIATLKAEEAQLKADLIESGESIVEGTLHRAAISEVNGKTLIDWRAVAEFYKPSRQLITAHTSQAEPYFTVRVSAHKA